MYNVKDPFKKRYVHLEEVRMRYQKKTWTYAEGNLQASDSGKTAAELFSLLHFAEGIF